MKREKSYNKVILEVLGTRPIAFNPILAKLTKSANAGLFMSQLLYWWNKGNKEGWVYKTIKDFQEETCLIRNEQDRAIKRWKELGVLEVERKGDPAVRHFKINIDKLVKLLKVMIAETSNNDC